MVDTNNHIETLIVTFLRGYASPEEAMLLQQWINASEENKQIFTQFEKLYSVTHNSESFDISLKENIWRSIKEITVKQEVKLIHFNRNQFVFALVAVLTLAFITTTIWFNNSVKKEVLSVVKTFEIKKNEVQNRTLVAVNGLESFTLSDLSNIKLSKGSKLIFDKNFNQKDRMLELKGSGEFQVVHDEEKPFILTVHKLSIIDIGTLFRVESNPDTVKIVVEEGAVELRLNGQIISMNAGDSAFYLIKKDFISQYSRKKERKNKVFEFDGTSLKEVVSILSEFFERPIVIKDKALETCPLTVQFKNESLVTILDIVKELMDIKIVNNNQVIELYGKGCN